ncbi:hypothetical protein PLESTM_001729700 [Pleodorina starrii]|nr:hypothetical protein PLESTM_001729700 [Pleodorina starrii]
MLKAMSDNGALGGVQMAPPSQPPPSLPLGPTASHPAATMAAAPSPFHGAAVPLAAAAAAALLPPTQFQRYYERMIEAHGEAIAELAAATSGGGGVDSSARCSELGSIFRLAAASEAAATWENPGQQGPPPTLSWQPPSLLPPPRRLHAKPGNGSGGGDGHHQRASGVPEQCWTPLDDLRQRGLPEIEATTEALVPASNLAAQPPQPYYNHVGQYPQPGASPLSLLPPSAAAFLHMVSFDGRKAQPSCRAAPVPGSPPMSRLPLRRPPSPLRGSGSFGGSGDLRPAGRMLSHCFIQRRAAGDNGGDGAGGASSAGPSACVPPPSGAALMDKNGPAAGAAVADGGVSLSAAGLYGFETYPLDPTAALLPFCPPQGQDGVHDGQFGSLPIYFGDMSGAMPQFDDMELPHGALPAYQPVPSSNPPTPPVMCSGNNAGERGGRGVRGAIGGNGGRASTRLETLFGKLVAISCDKQGSRLIQALLSVATSEQMGRCVEELLEGIMEVACHPYGNFVVQHLMTVCGFRHKLRLCGAMAGHILDLSLDPYGCRVVQKLLEVVPEQQAAAAVAEFDGHVLRCMRDKYAHYVLCSALYHVPHHSQTFLVDALQASLPSLARHPYGCRLAQSLLQTVSEANRRRAITWDLLQDAPQLGGHEYGNYVVQMLAQVGAPAVRSALTAALAPHALRLACCRHGSPVLEAVLKYGNDADREIMLHALLLECCNSGQQARLAMALYPVIPDLTARCAANHHPGMAALLARLKEMIANPSVLLRSRAAEETPLLPAPTLLHHGTRPPPPPPHSALHRLLWEPTEPAPCGTRRHQW